MADGLLASGLNYIDQQKQALAARLGLLMNNPQEFAAQLGSEARQRAGVGLLGEPKTAQEMASGAWINSPYGQQAMQAGSGFAGTTSPIKPVNLQALANEAYETLKANPSAINKQNYLAARDRANAEFVALRDQPVAQPVVQEAADYKGQHSAPMKDSGKPLWDLTGVYPEDFYSSQGARYYGHGEDLGRDTRIVSQIQAFRNQPNRLITVYRAVPKDVPRGKGINTGDWITTDLKYAKEHGQSALNNDFKIVKKTVRARDIFTNGDSIYEFGYDPQPYVPKSQK